MQREFNFAPLHVIDSHQHDCPSDFFSPFFHLSYYFFLILQLLPSNFFYLSNSLPTVPSKALILLIIFSKTRVWLSLC
ncbi:hypothetical protein E1A91_A01G203700v1 [Gossypium mustelinum]|uniref:Uncharacterized protein n=1 Tax=Gossypium mustelinum TaxID=34275 RepID=A0A5D3AJP6_GOSMU|nr:hypothetical protein E1A91_A01G203700v1 [Gossypium mustelinum]